VKKTSQNKKTSKCFQASAFQTGAQTKFDCAPTLKNLEKPLHFPDLLTGHLDTAAREFILGQRVRGGGQMAFRLGIGKFRLKGFSLPKFGVRGSLFAAFAVIAGMAIVILPPLLLFLVLQRSFVHGLTAGVIRR
jgi:hypothetical protein